MVTFGSGLGWLLAALGQPNWLNSRSLDFILPEGFTFLVLYGFPHIALARSLLLWGILFLLRAWGIHPKTRDLHLKWMAWAGFSWLLMGLVVPFYVAVAWAVMGIAWLTLGLRRKEILWREGLVAGLAVAISAPIMAYSAWVFTSDPVYATWAAQNLVLSPHPLHYLAAYGVLVVLATFAVRGAWRSEKPVWLPLAWVAIVPMLVYLPFNLQRRLVEGMQVPLSLLAALGVLKFNPRGGRLLVVATVLLIGLSLTNVLLVGYNFWLLPGRPNPIYRDAGEVDALDWLNGQVDPDDVVLAAYETGNYLPTRVGARAFVGHGPESVNAREKRVLVGHFFDSATDDAWREHRLEKYGVDYVFFGVAERALGDFDPHGVDYLERVYETDGYTLFEVIE
jgi:hypothetical protein